MAPWLIVVDDFLSDPQRVRDAALRLPYPAPRRQKYYPGRNSGERLVIAGLDEQVQQITGERLAPAGDLSHAQTRLATAGETGDAGVHVDACHWTGVLCLTLPADCQGGTDFFYHIATGTERVPVSQRELAALGMESPGDVWDRILTPDTLDPTKWERTIRVPLRYNRLVLFRPWYWHNAGPGVGDCVENGRLIYTMFYRDPDQPAPSARTTGTG